VDQTDPLYLSKRMDHEKAWEYIPSPNNPLEIGQREGETAP
jgi:hypothetical protein